MLVDSHCHLDFPQLSADLDGVVARAEAAGVGLMLTRSAIEQLGGRLTLINPEDGGALARIELPRQPAALTP